MPENEGIPPGTRPEMYIRLGSVEGKLDTLLKLREDDGSSFRGLAQDIREAMTAIHAENRAMVARVTELGAGHLALKSEFAAISHIVRDGDNLALVHRMVRVEQKIEVMAEQAAADRKAVAGEVGRFQEGIAADIQDLRAEIRRFAERGDKRDADVAGRAVEAAKEQRAHNRNVTITVVGTILAALLALATAAIQGAFSNHWK